MWLFHCRKIFWRGSHISWLAIVGTRVVNQSSGWIHTVDERGPEGRIGRHLLYPTLGVLAPSSSISIPFRKKTTGNSVPNASDIAARWSFMKCSAWSWSPGLLNGIFCTWGSMYKRNKTLYFLGCPRNFVNLKGGAVALIYKWLNNNFKGPTGDPSEGIRNEELLLDYFCIKITKPIRGVWSLK